jgi:hypothetical protein
MACSVLSSIVQASVGALGVAQQELECHRLRELGCAAEAAVGRIELAVQRCVGLIQHCVGDLALGQAAGVGLAHMRQQIGARFQQLGPAVLVGVGHGVQHLAERRHLVARRGRKIGAAVERHAVWRHEHGHRPAAAAGHGLDRGHIDIVDVGALLAVDFDVNEVFVHNAGGFFVFEALMGHDVAPMAGCITYT